MNRGSHLPLSGHYLRRKTPEHIGAILTQLWRERNWEEYQNACQPLLRWQELVGPQLARRSQPEFLKDGVLQVRVENSVWLNHLRFLSEELRQKLNQKISSPQIKEIRFRQGSFESTRPPPPSSPKVSQKQQVSRKPPLPLNTEQLGLLEEIPDADLRRALRTLLRKQQERCRK